MYRVIVADDEQIIREGLCKTIPWKVLGLELVGQAEHGLEAWELIHKHQPEIILTDIRMPHLDGIELIRKVREEKIDARIIILSGYSEFEYAQTAVKLGVSDYMMKPIDISAMCRELHKIKEELDHQYHHEHEVQELKNRLEADGQIVLQQNIMRYLRHSLRTEKFLESLPEELENSRYCLCALIQLDNFDHITGNMPEERIFTFTQELEEILFSQGEGEPLVIMEESNGRYVILFYGDIETDVFFCARSYIKRIRMSITHHDYTSAVSTVFSGIIQCPEAYEMAVSTLERAFLLGTNQDVEPEKEGDTNVPLPDSFDVGRIVHTIATFDKEAIRKEFDQIEEDIRKTRRNSFLYTRMMVSFVYGEVIKLLADLHCPIQEIMDDSTASYRNILTCQTLSGMMSELYSFIAQICDFLEEGRGSGKKVVDRARAYMEAHFANPSLTLDKVAREASMSPNYFSALFKQGAGKSFIASLTEIRLGHAKKLLESGDHRSYEVSYLCGYENPTYFSTIFKRHIGMSPSEYRTMKEGER